MFELKCYGGFSLFESFNLPIGLRNYYYKKLLEKLEKEKESYEKANNKNSRSR